MLDKTPGIPVSLFFDYSCPYCYIASHRLRGLMERHHLDVLWRFIETRPEVPAAGLTAGDQVDEALLVQARAEGLALDMPGLVPNTRRAILLAQATLLQRPDAFPLLHQRLFQAVFVEGKNIGDADELRHLAGELGLEAQLLTAWETSAAIQVVLSHVEEAQRHGLQQVPTIVVAERSFPGMVSVDLLEQALHKHAERP